MTTPASPFRSFRFRASFVVAAALLVALLGACSQTPQLPELPDAPVAAVSAPTSVTLGDPVTLDAGASSGEELSFAWSFVHTPGAVSALSSPSGSSTSFTPAAVGTYVVQVEVSNAGGSDTATAVLEVEARDVSGGWSAVLTPVGDPPIPFNLNLTQNGATIGGTIDAGGPSIPVSGSIDGDEVTLLVSGGSTITITATLNGAGNGMSGGFTTNDSPPVTGTFSASRP